MTDWKNTRYIVTVLNEKNFLEIKKENHSIEQSGKNRNK